MICGFWLRAATCVLYQHVYGSTNLNSFSFSRDVDDPRKTLQHWEVCQANSQDTESALSTSLPKSVPPCLACWTVWVPTSLLLTWDEFTHKGRSDKEFKERVDMARKHMNERGRGFRDSFPAAVKTSDDLAIRIIRRGRLLSPKDLRFDGQLFTPSQRSLKECNMKLSTLSGASIERCRAVSNWYASRCVGETVFSPHAGPPQKTVGCCRPHD